MKHFELNGTIRTTGNKTYTKNFRRQGLVPCNLYGPGIEENVIFTVSEKELKGVIYTPSSYIIDLTLDNGKKYTAIVREYQFHPVKDNCMHIDFLAVNEEKPITIDVPITVSGHPVGVQKGGKFLLVSKKISVCALMKDLPDTVGIDVSELDLDKSMLAGDIHFDEFSIVSPKSMILCKVKAGRQAAKMAQEGR